MYRLDVLLGYVFAIREVSSAIFCKFSFFKIYDFDTCWIMAYKIDQDIP